MILTATSSDANNRYSAHCARKHRSGIIQQKMKTLSLFFVVRNRNFCLYYILGYSYSLAECVYEVMCITCFGSFPSSATISTMMFPTAFVHNQPACSTDFIFFGAWRHRSTAVEREALTETDGRIISAVYRISYATDIYWIFHLKTLLKG